MRARVPEGKGMASTRRQTTKKWSRRVTETSDALDLEKDVFKSGTPREIASSLKRSAERSRRRKSEPYRSAMSMLVFYINRAGRTLSASRRRTLEQAKDELRTLFGRAPRTGTARRSSGTSARKSKPRKQTPAKTARRGTRGARAAR
jgi:hypothetical protein